MKLHELYKAFFCSLLIAIGTGCSGDDGAGAASGPRFPPLEEVLPKDPYYVLQPNAYELSAELADQVLVEPNLISFPEDGPGVAALLDRKPGDVLFAHSAKSSQPGAHNPLGLGRVIKTIYAEDGRLVITTRQAMLTEVFWELFYVSEGAFEFFDRTLSGTPKPVIHSAPPSSAQCDPDQCGTPGQPGDPSASHGFEMGSFGLPAQPEFEPKLDFEVNGFGEGSLSGSLEAAPELQIAPQTVLLIWVTQGTVRNFAFYGFLDFSIGFELAIQAALELTPGATKWQGAPFSGSAPGLKLEIPPVPFPGAPVPLTVGLEIQPECELTIAASAAIQASARRSWWLGTKGVFYDDFSHDAISHTGGPTDFGGSTCNNGFDHTAPCQNANVQGPAWYTLNHPNVTGDWELDWSGSASGSVEGSCSIKSTLKFLALGTAGPFIDLKLPTVGARALMSVGSVPGYCFSTGQFSMFYGHSVEAGVKVEFPLLGSGATLLQSPTLGLEASNHPLLLGAPLSLPLGDCVQCIATADVGSNVSCLEDGHCCSNNCNEVTGVCECSSLGGSCRGDVDCCNGTSCDPQTLSCVADCSEQVSCTPGEWACASSVSRKQCVQATNGCLAWATPSVCAPNELCIAGSCVAPPSEFCGDGSCVDETCSSCPSDCGPCCNPDGAACGWSGDCCSGQCQAGKCQWLSCGSLASQLGWGDGALCQQPGSNVCFGSGYKTSDCQLCCPGGSGAPSCTTNGNACSSSVQCCAGLTCTKDPADNTFACLSEQPPAPSCKQAGQSCSSKAECCGGLTCKGTCIVPAPTPSCTQHYENCSSSAQCCKGLSCKKDGDNTWACL